ncbi:MAG TPA: type II secretion system F family protein, partial [Opitutus sp.]|nr:type II secretion system F family protein [Opitutus sp.]
MPLFTYTARDSSGKNISDTLEAPSRRDALRVLAARGLQVIAATESVAVRAGGKARPTAAPEVRISTARGAPDRKQRLPLLEALHDLTTSGMSAGEAVRLLSLRIKEPALRVLCNGLWERLSEGAPLSRAMSEFPAVFDAATINLIQAGEATGSL